MHTAVIIPFRPRDIAASGADDPLLRWTIDGYRHQQLAPGHTLELRIGEDGGSAAPGPAGASDSAPSNPARLTRKIYPRIGAAAVRNQLARLAPADVLIFGNADARPEPDMVQRHVDALAKLPHATMVLGSAPWEKPPQPTVFDALIADTPMVFFYHQLQAGESYDFRHAWTLNLSVRYPDFLASGGFHDQLRPVYYEDLAFCFRLLGPTHKGIFFEPAARVLHRHPTTLSQYLDREELLGLMAPVLARVCPKAFAAIFKDPSAESLAAQFRLWVTMDRPMHRWIYRRLQEWASRPEESLDAGEREQILTTIYQMHVPLKRLAFRLGYLRGMELADDSCWRQRQPSGLWRAFVE